jgi:hypothetical protein
VRRGHRRRIAPGRRQPARRRRHRLLAWQIGPRSCQVAPTHGRGVPPQPGRSPPCRGRSPGVAALGWTKACLPRFIDYCETPLLMGHCTQTSVGIRHTLQNGNATSVTVLRTCYEEISCAPGTVTLVRAVPGRTTRAPSASASSSFAYWRAHEPRPWRMLGARDRPAPLIPRKGHSVSPTTSLPRPTLYRRSPRMA